MSYLAWFKRHGEKHAALLRKLAHLDDDALLAYFRFENLSKAEPDFCPLFAQNRRCHETKALNCYWCACPHFRFDDEGFERIDGKVFKSYCAIDAKDGGQIVSGDAIHQDCSRCLLPHKESVLRRHFSRDWFETMRDVTPRKTSS